MIDEILAFNRRFVAEKGYERYITDKYPCLLYTSDAADE